MEILRNWKISSWSAMDTPKKVKKALNVSFRTLNLKWSKGGQMHRIQKKYIWQTIRLGWKEPLTFLMKLFIGMVLLLNHTYEWTNQNKENSFYYLLYVREYRWHPMTPAMHKVLIHGAKLSKTWQCESVNCPREWEKPG